MSSLAAGVIGVISGGLGVMNLTQELFPSHKLMSPESCTVKIWAGLDMDNGLREAGGDAPDIRLWNNDGDFLGINDEGTKIPTGEARDISIHMMNRQQPTYALFSANKDPICIAYMGMTSPEGSDWGWTADWPAQPECETHSEHASWYWSNIVLGPRSVHNPLPCIWIGGNHSATGFQVYWPGFAGGLESTKDIKYTMDDYCGDDAFFYAPRRDQNPDKIHLGETTSQTRRDNPSLKGSSPSIRSNGAIHYSNDSRLIITSAVGHDVNKLCTSPASSGPDMVNTASGLFCDMSTKTLYPVCAGDVTGDCFDLAQEDLRLEHNRLIPRSNVKEYRHTLDWN